MTTLKIKKAEDSPESEELRIVWAEVFAPDRPDSGLDFMSKTEIRKMAYAFMSKMALGNVDVMHDNQSPDGVQIVESFIARDDDQTFIPGSWVVGVHIPDDATWEKVKKGELNGFSMEALAWTEKVEVEIDIPAVVGGKTSVRDGHEHEYFVTYDEQGNFLGGKTSVADGHHHLIKAGTYTETVKDHNHTFCAVDELLISR